MSVTVCAILRLNEDQPEALGKYFEITTPLLERARAKITQRFTTQSAVVGQNPPEMVVLVEYPTIEAVNSLFASKEYEQAKPYRDKAFSLYNVSVVSQDGLGQEANQHLSD